MDDPDKLIKEAAQARRESRLDDAHLGYTKAVTLCRARQQRRPLIHALKGSGQIECDRNNFEAALPVYQEAVALACEESDPLLLAHTVRHLGDVFRHLGRPSNAEQCYIQALQLYRDTPNALPLDLANAIRSMALLKESVGAAGAALSLWEEAHAIYASLGIQAGVAESKARTARIGRPDSA